MGARHRATEDVVAAEPTAETPPVEESAAQRLVWRVLMSFAVTGLVVAPLMATAGSDTPDASAAGTGSGVYSGDSGTAQPSTYARLTPSFGVPGTPDGFLFPGFGTTASSVQRAGGASASPTGLSGLAGAVAAASTDAAAPSSAAPAAPGASAPAAAAPAAGAGGSAPAGSASSGGSASPGTGAAPAPAAPAPAAPAPVVPAPAPAPEVPAPAPVPSLPQPAGGVVGGATDAVGEVVGGATDAVGGVVGGATDAVGGVVGGVTGGVGGLLGGG
ncbi:hypothetical protein SAMN06273567_113132 [Geodermatophilus aquaeductus]|uniref:Uncharacterized protein n=1 Tax=Geodermatophilus aquaeductus TaxID=1564161 RepID=A0A521FRD7_9ACTN|nr:hypothetical protein SAMN06273567_113132 [Geodermatophilus aquaeductus]